MNIKLVLIATVFLAVALAIKTEEESNQENQIIDEDDLNELSMNDAKDVIESDLVRLSS